MSKEPQPVLKSMEQVLKDVYEKHRTVVNPDDNWATWETCVEDGTVNVCYEAMSDWANQCTIGLSARLDWQINQSFKQSSEISALQKTIEEQKMEIERLKELMERVVRQNHVIYRNQNSSMTESQVAEEVELIWGHFKSKHNL